jgi:alkaline phosphatase/streptomycin-6-phosphatase
MTRTALALLDRTTAGRGFFLQVEGASIDKRAHMADPCAQIGETVAFDAAVQLVLEYAAAHPDTLVIVTADHAHSTQIIPDPYLNGQYPGVMSILITNEGAHMALGYATNLAGGSQNHTGTPVRVAAQGPGAARLAGVHDQTEVFDAIRRALDL